HHPRAGIPGDRSRARAGRARGAGRRRDAGSPQGPTHGGKRCILRRAWRRAARVHRRYGVRHDARRVGARLRSAARRVFAAGAASGGHASDAGTVRRSRGGRRSWAARAHALLSTGRGGRHPRDHLASLFGRDRTRGRWVVHRHRGTVMLVVMKHGATTAEIDAVVSVIEEMGYEARPMPGAQRTAVGLVGNDGRVDSSRISALSGVAQVIHVTQPYKQVSREWRPENTIVTIAPGVEVGGSEVVIMAGPCSVESEAQIVTAARQVKAAGASCLRGGAFKPRSSPYSFQGLGEIGLEFLATARRETGLAIVTEAMDESGAELVAEHADCIQIGARNMQNYSLLKFVGTLGKPVLLKRGLAATINDLLLSAEYVLASGNDQVILCERGVRTFDPATRNMFDLTAIPLVQQLSHLPIVADPSHGTGIRDKVLPMARAAVAAGADGILVEVHPNPERALSDGAQSLYPTQFAQLVGELRSIAAAIHRTIAPAPGTAPV